MSSRKADFLPGVFGRLSSANFDQSPPDSPMQRSCRLPPLHYTSPQSDSSCSPPTPIRCITPPQTSTLLEKHANPSYSAKRTQLPLSVYELPTATYMWARWTPRDEAPRERDPVIFVYRPPKSDLDSSSGYSRSSSRSSYTTSSSHSSPDTTPPPAYSRKRSSSAGSNNESASSPSDRFLKRPRHSHSGAPNGNISARSVSGPPRIPVPNYYSKVGYPGSASCPGALGAHSNSSDVDGRETTPSYLAHQSNCQPTREGTTVARSMPPAMDPEPATAPPRMDEANDPRKNWTLYVQPPPEDPSAGPDFSCTWKVKRDGRLELCGYSSKKHLVKRHIESKHLQLRPCRCPFCGKGFAQKSNLDTHINTHTGDAPHQCLYCNESFKDPARRHRHMIQAHAHRSSRLKKDRILPEHLGRASSGEGSEPDAEES